MTKHSLIIVLCIVLAGCSALDVISKVLPSSGGGTSVSADLQVGDKENEIGSMGATEVEQNHGTITTSTEGLPPMYLVLLIGLVLAAMIGVLYISFQMGLRTPRPLKYTSEGRR